MNNPRKNRREGGGCAKESLAVANGKTSHLGRPRSSMEQHSFKLLRVRQFQDTIQTLTSQHEVVFLNLRTLEASGVARAIATACSKRKTPVLVLVNDDDCEAASDDSNGTNASLMESIRAATQKLRYEEERAVLRRIQSELELAGQIQRGWIPKSPRLSGFDIGGNSVAATETWGDLFDYFPMAGKNWGFALGDVCGHGVGPAMVLSIARAMLRSMARNDHSVYDLMTGLNHELSLNSPIFMTLVLVRLDPGSGQLTYGCAGHEGFLIDVDGNVRTKIEGSCPPLNVGIDLADHLIVGRDRLRKGELLFMCTDGVTENAAPGSNELFGIRRALEVIKLNRDKPAKMIIERLFQATRRFSGQEDPKDDMASVIIKRTK